MIHCGPVGLRAVRDMAASVSERFIRSQRAAVADVGDASYLVARDGTVRRLDGDTAELARVLLAFFVQPRTEDEVIGHVESLSGPLGAARAVVQQLFALLVEAGAVSKSSDPASRPGQGINIVVCATGAIAATQTPALVGALLRRGHTVEVALTETARRFVAVDALAAIAGREVHTTLWPSTPHAPVPHVALAGWADLVIVYPASGTSLHRIATGDFSDLVSAIAITTRAPVVLAPSMNNEMVASTAVVRNLEQLRADGFVIVDGVPSQEVADAPSVRKSQARVAPSAGELVATIEALRAAGVLSRRGDGEARRAVTAADWDAIYRAAPRGDGAPLVPWASDTCDPDLAVAIDTEAPLPGRLLDVGCGLGQVALHAATRGHTVVATDISEVALRVAVERSANVPSARTITWLRDDICASELVGPFDVIVDRATLHTLAAGRIHAWAQTMRRLARPGTLLILKTHRDDVPGITTGWSADAIRALLPDFGLVETHEGELPGLRDATPVPSLLAVLRRR
jgi:phosphopantothenoylcysteine decarboxylase